MPSLEELGVDQAKILRVIETLKVNGKELHPGSIALELGIPRSYIYENLEFLQLIYSSMDDAFGHDKLIVELIHGKNKLERKIKKLEKKLAEMERGAENSFNEGFSKGASLNYDKVESEQRDLSLGKEIWARSVLHLDLSESLDQIMIKKAYRKIVSLIHPDITGEDTNEMMSTVKGAFDFLLSKYE